MVWAAVLFESLVSEEVTETVDLFQGRVSMFESLVSEEVTETAPPPSY